THDLAHTASVAFRPTHAHDAQRWSYHGRAFGENAAREGGRVAIERQHGLPDVPLVELFVVVRREQLQLLAPRCVCRVSCVVCRVCRVSCASCVVQCVRCSSCVVCGV